MTRNISKRIQVGLAATVLGVGLAAGTASALEGCSNSDCGSVLPTNDQMPNGTEAETVTAPTGGPTAGTQTTTSGGTLPFTGSDVLELSVVGLGAIGAGTIMVRRSRARRVTA